jgi:Cytosine/uracil/thiamine/allantoin permeases
MYPHPMVSRIEKFLKWSEWALEPQASSFAPDSRWSNQDMDPVPAHLRTWTAWNYVAYWISDAANVAGWELASSMLAIGLSWCDVTIQQSLERSHVIRDVAGDNPFLLLPSATS